MSTTQELKKKSQDDGNGTKKKRQLNLIEFVIQLVTLFLLL